MSEEIPVNLPDGPGSPETMHPDFPSGADLMLLMDIRVAIREKLIAMGLPNTGGGVGVGGADESFRLGARSVHVTIEIREPA